MRTVRIIFKKKDRLKYVSHLDMNRVMTRILRLSEIPVWYTEGFNPHPYLTFALPLSLGFESDYEIMDIRITDDEYKNEQVKSALSAVCPEYIEIFYVADAVQKPGKIAFADFHIRFMSNEDISAKLREALSKDSIKVMKTGKKGKVSEIDLAPKIKHFDVEYSGENTVLKITLPQGGADNVNPNLLLSACGELPYYRVTRTMVYDAELHPFK